MEKDFKTQEFKELLNIIESLIGPNGCPWDQVQTMKSTRPCIIEESSELVEAIDSQDNSHIQEELGDLFFVVAFLCRLAEKEKRCTIAEVLHGVNEKLIRRHPHVFDNTKLEEQTSAAVIKQWGEIKKKEQAKANRKSALEGIPKGLPALARAQKVQKKLLSAKYPESPKSSTKWDFQDEDSLGNLLLELTATAQEKGLDAEHALRKVLVDLETSFQKFESVE